MGLESPSLGYARRPKHEPRGQPEPSEAFELQRPNRGARRGAGASQTDSGTMSAATPYREPSASICSNQPSQEHEGADSSPERFRRHEPRHRSSSMGGLADFLQRCPPEPRERSGSQLRASLPGRPPPSQRGGPSHYPGGAPATAQAPFHKELRPHGIRAPRQRVCKRHGSQATSRARGRFPLQ